MPPFGVSILYQEETSVLSLKEALDRLEMFCPRSLCSLVGRCYSDYCETTACICLRVCFICCIMVAYVDVLQWLLLIPTLLSYCSYARINLNGSWLIVIQFALSHSSPCCLQFVVEGRYPFECVCNVICCYWHAAAEMMMRCVEL
jgi:hypothetical protein